MFANLFGSKEAATAKPPHATPPIPEGTTLEQVRSELLHLMAQENLHHHRMGQLYNYIVDNELAEKAGYKNARDFLSQRLADLSQAALSRYGAVAAEFSATVARRFGVTCLSLLLTYAEATGLELNHEEPGSTPIEVPDEKGQVHAQPFSACSVEQMRRALLRKRRPTSTQPLPEEAVARADQYREAVTSRFPRGVRVKVQVRNHKGKAVLDFKGIPLEQVSQLVEALLKELSPVRPVEQVPAA